MVVVVVVVVRSSSRSSRSSRSSSRRSSSNSITIIIVMTIVVVVVVMLLVLVPVPVLVQVVVVGVVVVDAAVANPDKPSGWSFQGRCRRSLPPIRPNLAVLGLVGLENLGSVSDCGIWSTAPGCGTPVSSSSSGRCRH